MNFYLNLTVVRIQTRFDFSPLNFVDTYFKGCRSTSLANAPCVLDKKNVYSLVLGGGVGRACSTYSYQLGQIY